jgi:hypothetical protein
MIKNFYHSGGRKARENKKGPCKETVGPTFDEAGGGLIRTPG